MSTNESNIFILLSRILRENKHDMRHHDKMKLPTGKMLVPMKGFGDFNVGDMVFRAYYVSCFFSLLPPRSSLDEIKVSCLTNTTFLHITEHLRDKAT